MSTWYCQKTGFLLCLYVPYTPVIRSCTVLHTIFTLQCFHTVYVNNNQNYHGIAIWYFFFTCSKSFSNKLLLNNISAALDLYHKHHTSHFRCHFSIGKHWYQVVFGRWGVVRVTVFTDPHLVARVQVLEPINGNSNFTLELKFYHPHFLYIWVVMFDWSLVAFR